MIAIIITFVDAGVNIIRLQPSGITLSVAIMFLGAAILATNVVKATDKQDPPKNTL